MKFPAFAVVLCAAIVSVALFSLTPPVQAQTVAAIAFDNGYPSPGVLDSDNIVYKGTYTVTFTQTLDHVQIYYYNANDENDFGSFQAQAGNQFGGKGAFEYTTGSLADGATYHCWAVLYWRGIDGVLHKGPGTPTVDVAIQ